MFKYRRNTASAATSVDPAGLPKLNGSLGAAPLGNRGKLLEARLVIDPTKVTKEGFLRKKDNHLYSRFKKKHFYLEDYLLKFGTL